MEEYTTETLEIEKGIILTDKQEVKIIKDAFSGKKSLSTILVENAITEKEFYTLKNRFLRQMAAI